MYENEIMIWTSVCFTFFAIFNQLVFVYVFLLNSRLLLFNDRLTEWIKTTNSELSFNFCGLCRVDDIIAEVSRKRGPDRDYAIWRRTRVSRCSSMMVNYAENSKLVCFPAFGL